MVIGKWYRLQWHNDTQRETGGKSGWEKADERPDGVVLPYNKGKLAHHTEASGKCGLWVSCPHTPFSPSFPDLQSPVYRVTTLPVIAEDVVRAARDVWENVFGIVFFRWYHIPSPRVPDYLFIWFFLHLRFCWLICLTFFSPFCFIWLTQLLPTN